MYQPCLENKSILSKKINEKELDKLFSDRKIEQLSLSYLNINTTSRKHRRYQSNVLESYLLMPSQFLLEINTTTKSITFAKGVDTILGYDPDNIIYKSIFEILFNDRECNECNELNLAIERINSINLEVETSDAMLDLSNVISFKHYKGHKIDCLLHLSPLGLREENELESILAMAFVINKDASPRKHFWLEQIIKDGKLIQNELPLVRNESVFSKREVEILLLLNEGMKSQEISKKLFISVNTVYNHRAHLLKKSNAKNTTQLLSFARDKGVI